MISPSPPVWEILTSKSGVPTASVNNRIIHSRFDPVREAIKVADNIPANTGIIVLAGLGLGYVAQAIVQSKPDIPLIIAEATQHSIEEALKVRDLSTLLTNPHVTLFCQDDPQQITSLLTGGPVGSDIHYLPWKPAMFANEQWYRELEAVIKETCHRRKINAYTLERFGSIWIRNLISNRSVLANAISIDAIYNRFEDIPALVLAAGPTLDEILPYLWNLSKKFLIFTVDTALRAVLKNGVVPDIVAAVDPQYWNTRHLDYCHFTDKHPLVLAETATHPAVFERLKGRCIMMRTRFPLGTVFEDAAGLHGELKAGGSVTTALWELARHLGCNPILTAGLDLGFPNKRSHYRGSLSSKWFHMYSNRLSGAENAFFAYINDAGPHMVKDMAGRPLLTDQRMDVYHAWFAENVKKIPHQQPCVIGDKGRYIEGMGIMTADDLGDFKECRDAVDAILDEIIQLPVNQQSVENLTRASEELGASLKKIRDLAREGSNAAHQAFSLLGKGQDAAIQLDTMAKVDHTILSSKGLGVVSFLIQPIIREIVSNADESADPLETSRRLYSQILKSADYHLRYLFQGHADRRR